MQTVMRTILHDRHVNLGAKLVEFCGWEMPIQYSSVIEEHNAVRSGVGIFDVSHMGRVEVSGPQAEEFLDYLSTNKISGKKDCTATYTVWPNENGGTVDDCIVYRRSAEDFFVVVNAGNRDKDLAHMKKYAKNFDVQVKDYYEKDGILAVQGPKSLELMAQIFPEIDDLKFMRFADLEYKGKAVIVARAGYTGEAGVEIYAENHVIAELWDKILDLGQPFDIRPIGLAARDTLRLEMGFALYGHELTDDIAAIESVSAWTVRFAKGPFVGSEAMQKLEASGSKRQQIGLEILDRGIAREGAELFFENEKIGWITSGTQAPSLSKAIAIAISSKSLEEGATVEVQVRKRALKARVCKIPFYSNK
ncbi:MAG: glycine cleavage system protein T [Waddliaceae bacterium]|nr:glycine cleavage system protein T [Waddliaceae bacterium]